MEAIRAHARATNAAHENSPPRVTAQSHASFGPDEEVDPIDSKLPIIPDEYIPKDPQSRDLTSASPQGFPWDAFFYTYNGGEIALGAMKFATWAAGRWALLRAAVSSFGRSSLGAAERAIPKLTRAMISQREPIARGAEIKKIGTLIEKFGGKVEEWTKYKTWDSVGTEIHWYERSSKAGIERVGMKWAGFNDPF